MGKITYYLAISLDGYLAKKDGSVDWLTPFQHPINSPYDYKKFYATVSAIIMGRKTWEVARSLEGHDIYPGIPKFVFTRQTRLEAGSKTSDLTICNKDLATTIKELKNRYPDRIWLVGGADLAAQLVDVSLLDEIILTIVPLTLGSGILWLAPHASISKWRFVELYSDVSGLVQLAFRRSPL